MTQPITIFDAYLEIGNKRFFAGAVDWPGWCRSGRDEGSALLSLYEYGPRYARALQWGGIAFQAPTNSSAFEVIERLPGTPTTDFGAPDVAPLADSRPIDDAELARFQALLKAFWMEFDTAVRLATGKELRRGPRGGGRDLEKVVEHVLGGEKAYLARVAWKLDGQPLPVSEDLEHTHQACLKALENAVRHGLPERGPRGGAIWTPRYFVRRAAWHVLDHAWEIEDRMQ